MTRVYRILVVEDSRTQAFMMRVLLEEQGWHVTIAGAAETALAALGDPLPDLILLDYNLPGMRGDEFCRRIRMNLNTRGISILMMTALSPEKAEANSLDSGADDYVSKLVSPEVLLLRIRMLLRRAPEQKSVLIPQYSAFVNASILAIDDDPAYLEFLGNELRTQGYEMESAPTGQQGLALLTTRRFECVLVDLTMPVMDGVEVCRQITAMRASPESAPAVIILSASPATEDMTRAFEAGTDDFVSKTSDVAVIRARIQALMRRSFLRADSHRISDEFEVRDMQTLQARADYQVAEARVAMSEKLVQANLNLEEANRKLKETQAQLIHNEKMASLGHLVAGIAHEINNPLAFVINNLFIAEGVLDSLKPEMEPLLTPASREQLQKARIRLEEMNPGLDRVKELVLDLRAFSRLDGEEFRTVDAVDMIDAVLALFKFKMSGRITVEKYYAPERMLHCSEGRLRQVVMNLISNAVDAIAAEGTMTVSTSLTPAGCFLISVRDTGAGIPEAIQSKIFDPFFTTKPVGKGTGLGLAISYGIVQDHEGSIAMRSEAGNGTEFTVSIPADLESRCRK